MKYNFVTNQPNAVFIVYIIHHHHTKLRDYFSYDLRLIANFILLTESKYVDDQFLNSFHKRDIWLGHLWEFSNFLTYRWHFIRNFHSQLESIQM